MKCPNCGKDNKKGIQFCVNCSTRLNLEYDSSLEPALDEIKEPPVKELVLTQTQLKKTEMNETDKYLEAERERIRIREEKEQKKNKRYNNPNNKKDATLAIKIFIIIIILTTIVMIIGLFAYEETEKTEVNNYGEYDYSDIKNNDTKEKDNALYYNDITLTFMVPNNLVSGDYSLAYNKYFRDKNFTKSINYSMQRGKADKLADSMVEYYTHQKNTSKTDATISKENIKVNDHEFIYVKYAYKTGEYTSTSIFGYSQIDDYVYKVEYRDYNSGDIIPVEKLFKYEIVKD